MKIGHHGRVDEHGSACNGTTNKFHVMAVVTVVTRGGHSRRDYARRRNLRNIQMSAIRSRINRRECQPYDPRIPQGTEMGLASLLSPSATLFLCISRLYLCIICESCVSVSKLQLDENLGYLASSSSSSTTRNLRVSRPRNVFNRRWS